VDFERGTELAVEGPRDLALCPATATGTLYPGFCYGSDAGTHAALLHAKTGNVHVYYNGGCWFDFSTNRNSPLVYTVAGTYAEKDNRPAIVFGTKPDDQQTLVVLSGVHIEYDPIKVAPRRSVLVPLKDSATERLELWNYILSSLGLDVAHKSDPIPSPTPLHMFFSNEPAKVSFIQSLNHHAVDGVLKCEQLAVSFGDESLAPKCDTDDCISVRLSDQARIDPSWTFSPHEYFALLKENGCLKGFDHIGSQFLYAEYINSTQTILTQNPRLASTLPNGSFILAGDQLAGKGRGQNTWLSSKGCLQFTMVLHHHQTSSSLALIQYLVGLSMVEAILNEPGYSMGGILVNSQVFQDGFLLLIGFGTSVYDTPWTRSLNELVQLYNSAHGTTLSPWTKERLLARFYGKFREYYRQLTTVGFPFDDYHKRWLHTGKIVFVESEQMKARIEGIDPNGFLIARPHSEGLLGLLDSASKPSSSQQPFLLQPDGNSFDMMKNLIKRK
ncbi:Biotin--protein ligase, partial [Paramicrosporidium saccamoebae]